MVTITFFSLKKKFIKKYITVAEEFRNQSSVQKSSGNKIAFNLHK